MVIHKGVHASVGLLEKYDNGSGENVQLHYLARVFVNSLYTRFQLLQQISEYTKQN